MADITSDAVLFDSNGNILSSGTALSGATITMGGSMVVADKGTAEETTVSSGGFMYISSGGVANSTTVNRYGSMHISSGGVANSTTVSGYMYISSGGVADSAAVSSGGYIHVRNGGVANSATVNSNGSMYISSGGTATDIIVSAGGGLMITVAADTYIQGTSNGSAFEMKDATLNDFVTGDKDFIYVLSGGSINNTTMKGGYLEIRSGGTATDISWTPGVGVLEWDNDSFVTFTSQYSGVYHASAGKLLQNTPVLTGNLFSSGVNYNYVYVFSNGIIESATLEGSVALRIHSGGIIKETSCGSGYETLTLYLSSGALAQDITIGSFDYVYVSQGAYINGITLTNNNYHYGKELCETHYTGCLCLKNCSASIVGGSAANINIYGYADLRISSGGVATDIVASGTTSNGGGIIVGERGSASNISLQSAYLMIYDSGYVENTIVSSNGIIFCGGTANNTMVSSGGYMHISSGGSANSTTVNTGAQMTIFGGGVANSAAVNSGGRIIISSGGTATDVIWTPCVGNISAEEGAYVTYASQYSGVYFGFNNQLLSSAMIMDSKIVSGSMYVMSDGAANRTQVKGYGYMYISSGGVANGTTLISSGCMVISSGGVANSTTVSSGGKMHISSGGVANSTTVNSYGSMHISSGGVANSTTVNYLGHMYISSGGVANSTTVKNYGRMFIEDGGVANSTMVNYDGCMYISSGGVANSTTVNVSGNLMVSSGGAATKVLENGGYVFVADGATVEFLSNTIQNVSCYTGMTVHSNTVANNTTVNNSGSMYISSGGVANDTAVNYSGNIYISSGGVANNTTVNSGGSVFVSNGGVANSTTVNSGGQQRIFSGGVANSATVNSCGSVGVANGGVANSATVNSKGYMYIASGGMATGIIISAGGSLGITVAADTYIQGTSNGSAFEMKDAVLNGYTVNGGWVTVLSGGVANNTTVNYSGNIYISSGGVANSTTVISMGSMHIFSGGIANSTTVNVGGNLMVSSGGAATNVLENGGCVFVVDGAAVEFLSNTIQDRTFYTGMTVHSNTVASNITLSAGGYMVISSGGVADSTAVSSGGYMSVRNGGVANSTTILAGGSMHISSGGVANSTTVSSSGDMVISSGGVANSTTVNYRGYMGIFSRGKATNTTVSWGGMYISSGGVANSTTILAGGSMFVNSGGVASNTTVNSEGLVRIFSYGQAVGLTLKAGGVLGGFSFAEDKVFDRILRGSAVVSENIYMLESSMYVQSNGIANSITVLSYGHMIISNGGTANNTTLNDVGYLYISSGGIANNTTVNSWGYMHVSNGGVADVTTVNGSIYVASGGIANSTTVNSGGSVFVNNGGVANSTTVNSGGYMYVRNGGVANSTTVNYRGNIYISSGGAANSTTVNNGGYLYISSGVIANSTTVNGGQMTIDGVANDIIMNHKATVANFTNTGSDAAVVKQITGNVVTGDLDGGKFSGSITCSGNLSITNTAGSYKLTLQKGKYIVTGNDFSDVTFSIASDMALDFSGNYWGITDIEAIYEKYGFSKEQVTIDNVLFVDPTTTFNVTVTGLKRNTFSRRTESFTVVFSHEFDEKTITLDAFKLTDRDGKTVMINSLEIIDDKTLKLNIATPEVEGRYHLDFSASIKDQSGASLVGMNSAQNSAEWVERITLKADYTAPYVVSVTPEHDFAGTLQQFSITFSDAIDAETLQGNVHLLGPDGNDIALKLQTVANGVASFTMSPQTAYGEYTIVVDEEVTDFAGNKLDQNRNGIDEETGDAYTHSFQITNVDLKVADVTLNKTTFAPGETVTVDWNTFNNGGYVLSGSWTDGIYLSTDTRWDINDIKLGELVHNGGLAKDQQLANTRDVKLTGIAAGNYYILVRSDIYMQEKGDRESALAAQNLQAVGITVTVPELIVNNPVNGHISKSGEYCVYKLTQNVNEALELVLDSHTDSTNMEIYVGKGYSPTREKYDSKVQRLTDGKLVLAASDTEQELYVMVYNKSTRSAFNYTLTAQAVPLGITGISGSTQGNRNGSVFELTGVNFAPDMVVMLTDANGNKVAADKLTFINNTKVKVEFAAGILAAGNYSLSASNNGETASYDENVTIVQDSGAKFNIKVITPLQLTWRQITTISAIYSNTGYDMMDAPLITIHPRIANGQDGAFLSLDKSILTTGFLGETKPAGFDYSLQFLASGNSPGVLEAGKQYNLPIYYAGWRRPIPIPNDSKIYWNISYIESDNTDVLDWSKYLVDAGKTEKEIQFLSANLTASVGNTYGDYVKMLNRNMRYLYENNISTDNVTVTDLFNLEYRWASGDITYTPELSANTDNVLSVGGLTLDLTRNYYSDFDSRLQTSSFGNGWTCSWDMYLEFSENDDLIFVDGESRRLFQPNVNRMYTTVANDGSEIKKQSDGSFKLTESNGEYRIFDSNGVLQSITTADNKKITFEYANGKLSKIVSGNETRTITRNEAGLITAVTDRNGSSQSYTYDNSGNLISVTDSTGKVTSYTYEAEQLNALSSITQGSEISKFEYDATGRLTQWSVDGHTYKYDYGTIGMVSVSYDGKLIGTNYYGVDGALVKTVAPDQLTRGNIVYGTLTDADGKALAGITVNAIADDKIYTAVTDVNGIYSFTGITDDWVTFTVQDAQYKSVAETDNLSGIDFTSLRVEKASNSIIGTYSYADDALAEAVITLTNKATGEYSIVRGYTGKFAAYDLAAGEYSMQISAGDSATYYGSFTVTEDSKYQNLGNYDLKVGGNIAYTLTSDSSLKNTVVQLIDKKGNVVAGELLSTGGTYTFENIAAGNYTLSIFSSLGERYNVSKEITVETLKNTEITITLDDGVAISGQLKDANGNAHRGMYLELASAEDSFLVHTDYYGNYSLENLTAGEYTLSIYGSNTAIKTFTVKSGDADIVYNHQTDYCASWEGYLSDSEGMTATGNVSLYLDGEYLDSLYAADGYFRFDMKKAGNYSIIAEGENGFFTQVESADIVSGSEITSEFTLGTYTLTVNASNVPAGETTYILSQLDAKGNVISSNYSTSPEFTGLTAGSYQLTAYNGNYKAESKFEVTGNRTQELAFEELNELKIQLTEIEEALNVLLYNANGEIVDSLYIDESGTYTFKALEAANYKLVAFSDSYNAMQDITVSADTGIIDLELAESTKTISGTVTVDGEVIEGIFIYVYNEDKNIIGWSISDADGNYSVKVSESGQYQLLTQYSGCETYLSEKFVSAGISHNISLQTTTVNTASETTAEYLLLMSRNNSQGGSSGGNSNTSYMSCNWIDCCSKCKGLYTRYVSAQKALNHAEDAYKYASELNAWKQVEIAAQIVDLIEKTIGLSVPLLNALKKIEKLKTFIEKVEGTKKVVDKVLALGCSLHDLVEAGKSRDALSIITALYDSQAALWSIASEVASEFFGVVDAIRSAYQLAETLNDADFDLSYELRQIEICQAVVDSIVAKHHDLCGDGCNCKKDDDKDTVTPSPTGGFDIPTPDTEIRISYDPNDKTVMEGFGEKKYIAGDETLNYKVEFENDPEFATAPARWVRVYDTLAAEYDLDTFVINSICLAGNYIAVGDGRDSYNQMHEITVNGDEKVLVQISINLDHDTREIFAEFTAIDPETGFMLQNVDKGLLFPNDENGCGEGYFTYSIGLKEGIAHGTEVKNKADIYFDFNEVIETPTTLNTVDSVAPDKVSLEVKADKNSRYTFTLKGADADSGVKGYNIDYSTDGKSFTALASVTGSSWTCELDSKQKYYFRAQAVDNVGNVSVWSQIAQSDTTPPKRGKITLKQADQNSVKVTISGFSDNVKIARYDVYVSGKKVGSTTGTTYTYKSGANLTAGSKTFAVKAIDTAGNISTSAGAKLTVNLAVVGKATSKSTVLTWKAASVSGGRKQYEVVVSGKKYISTTNKITIKGLAVGSRSVTVYARSKTNKLTKLDSGDIIKVTDGTAPTGGKVVAAQSGQKNIKVTISGFKDNVKVTKYYVYVNGKKVATTTSTSYTYKSSVNLIGKKTIAVKALDAAGNVSASKSVAITIKDVTAPSKVTGLKVSGTPTQASAKLVWTKGVDNVGVTKYAVKVSGVTKLYTTTTNALTVKGLTAGKHTYQVYAYDATGRKSVVSTTYSFNVKDITKPTGGKITLKQASQNSVKITISSFKDNVKVGKYYVYLNGKKIATTTSTTYTYTQSANFTTSKLTFAVKAVDTTGNVSVSKSAAFAAKVRVSGKATNLSTVLTWTKPSISGTLKRYEITVSGKKYTSTTNKITIKGLAVGTRSVTIKAINTSNQSKTVCSGELIKVVAATVNKTISGITDGVKDVDGITGSAANDIITFQKDRDFNLLSDISLGSGDDKLIIPTADDCPGIAFENGAGIDFGAGNDTLELGANALFGYCDQLAGDDIFAEKDLASGYLDFGTGNDTLRMGTYSECDTNSISFGDGNDVFQLDDDALFDFPGPGTVAFGAGNDKMILGNDVNLGVYESTLSLDFGSGTDTMTFDGEVHIHADQLLITGLENITGSGSLVLNSCTLDDETKAKFEQAGITVTLA